MAAYHKYGTRGKSKLPLAKTSQVSVTPVNATQNVTKELNELMVDMPSSQGNAVSPSVPVPLPRPPAIKNKASLIQKNSVAKAKKSVIVRSPQSSGAEITSSEGEMETVNDRIDYVSKRECLAVKQQLEAREQELLSIQEKLTAMSASQMAMADLLQTLVTNMSANSRRQSKGSSSEDDSTRGHASMRVHNYDESVNELGGSKGLAQSLIVESGGIDSSPEMSRPKRVPRSIDKAKTTSDLITPTVLVENLLLNISPTSTTVSTISENGANVAHTKSSELNKELKDNRDYTVSPRSEAIITGKMQGKPIGSLFAIEPKNSLQQDSLMIARTVAGQDQERTPIRILNPSDSIVEIKVGEHLADAEAAQVVEGENVEEPPAANLPEHLKFLFDETCTRENLSEAAQCGLQALLLKHKNVFAKDDNDMGRTDLVVHDINNGDARPIHQPPRRVPSALQPELEANLSSMLEKRVAEPGQSPWTSPVVLVRKKDDSIRFCVVYRRLNAVTQFDAYPLPRIDEPFEALSGLVILPL